MSSRENNVVYPSPEEILVIHAKIIDETGGSHGVRDVGLLQSAAMRPQTAVFGKELFAGVFAKAAALLDSLTRHHVFVDGNKRTAFAAAARFLFVNDFELNAPDKEVVRFMVAVATKKPSLEKITVWLKRHSKPIRKKPKNP
jgi:death-on-curing protein